jgi:abortive infection bacteriophage resistance protein
MKFEKPALQTVEHIQLLRDRGLEITDPMGLRRAIDQFGFFRLLGYMIPFEAERETHTFQDGITDQTILLHYQFDRRLRFVMMEGVEAIEVSLKAAICNLTAVSFGPHWYLNPDHFNNRDHHQRLLDYISEASKESSEQFIKRYREEFHAPSLPPIWMVMELLTFGKLCSLYSNMKDSDEKKAIAAAYDLPVSILSSWLLSLNYIRNCCAHHMRLWNRWLPLRPMIPSGKRYRFLSHIDDYTDKQLFGVACCILFLLKAIGQDNLFRQSILSLLGEYPAVNQRYMGFHAAWREESIWQGAGLAA